MHILFVEPPPTLNWNPDSVVSTAGRRHPSLNVTGERVYSYINLSAAAVLRQRGHSVSYLHCQTEGVDVEGVKRAVEKLHPDMLVIQAEHINLNVAFRIALNAKDIKDITVAFVGPLATAIGEEWLPQGLVDVVVRREWDYIVANLADKLEHKEPLDELAGISFLNGSVKHTPDAPLIQNLDELPFPAYDMVEHRNFYEAVFKRFPAATAITSRGCPFHCIYCAYPQTIYNHKFRAQSPERVLEEAKFLNRNFGIREIRYDDDTFEIDRERAIKIAQLFQQEKLDLIWNIQSRPSLIDLELAQELKKGGCSFILFGVESGEDEILKLIGKNTSAAKIEQGVRNAHKAGLDILNCVMIGFWWDTPQTIRKTIDFAFKLNAEFTQFSIATPLPGTQYYNMLKDGGYMQSDNWEDSDSFHHANFNYPHLSGDWISEQLKGIYRKYYTRPKYIWRMGRRALRSRDNFNQTIRGVKALLTRVKEGWA